MNAIRILYVDDYPLDRELVRDALEKEHGGFQVIEAASRADFEVRLAEGSYDVVLSDFNILGFEGLQVIAAVHANHPHIPVVIVTGTGSEEIAVEALKRGAADYVIKSPQHIRRLPETIHAVLEKRRLEEERQRVEQERDRLFNFSIDLLCIASFDGYFKQLNPAWEKTLRWTNAELMAKPYLEFVHPDDREATTYAAGRLANGKLVISFENRYLCQDGAYKWISWNAYPLVEEGLIFAVARDVTGQKQREQEYQELINGMNDTAFVIDFNARFVEVNDTAVKTLGYSKEELLALGPADIDPHLSRDEIITLAKRMKSDKQQVFETQHWTKYGDIIPVEVSSSLVTYHGEQVILSIVRDITERKRAEDTLRESEEKFRLAFDTSPDSIAITRLADGMLVSVNKGFKQISGYTQEEIIGKTSSEINSWKDPEDRRKFVEELQSRGEVRNYEAPLLTRSGEIYGLMSASIIDLNGEPHVLGIIRDITERKQAEQELRKYQNHLEELVKERTTELYQEISVRARTEQDLLQAKEAAEKANRAKSEFLANMSHDLRTPLNAVLRYAQILKDEDNLTTRQREGMQTIQSSGEHLLALINDILHLAKIEAGKLKLQRDECPLHDFLKQILNMIQIRADQQGITFVPKLAPNLPLGICTDENRLREILLNLLGNAIKFTEQGTITLRVKQLPIEQDTQPPSANTPRTRIRFEVEDTGIGIAEDDLVQIFEAFHQVETRSQQIGGTGLGLAISRQLVQMMGGELQVSSVPDQGSTFWFELEFPVVAHVHPERERPSRKIVGYSGPRRTILVVDDEPANRGLLLNLLYPLGFHLGEATNGQECVEKASTLKPDLILLDLRMPVMDGFRATEEIRRLKELDEMVIIAVSASVFESTRQRAKAVGFHDFLFKPIDLEKVTALLQQSLGLDWIYEEPAVPLPTQPSPDLTTIQLPADEIRRLYAFAVRGDYKNAREQLMKIETLGERFSPLVKELWVFIDRFDMDAIAARLEELGITL